MKLFFSDYFGVSKTDLDSYGGVDISLVSDIPLFVDPFLLFNSEDPVYQELHSGIIKYLLFLRDKSAITAPTRGQLEAWYKFSEVRQNWLGFTILGNSGSGLGLEFAEALHQNLHIFHNSSEESITASSHLEKLCLIKDGVGKDNISDFTTNLIKEYLLEYTQAFAIEHIDQSLLREVRVRRAYFNYETESWADKTYTLPFYVDDFVVLTPKAMLTKDETWINKADLVGRFSEIPDSISDEQLRYQVNNYFRSQLPPRRPTARERREAAIKTIREFPDLIDYYIKLKETSGEQAVHVSEVNVGAIENKVRQAQELLEVLTLEFTRKPASSLEEAIIRGNYLKHCIEDRDGYKIINHPSDVKPSNEKIVQLLFVIVWFGSIYDINRETDNGRGQVDFTTSFGALDKTIVEFKLGSNPRLKHALEKQTEIYLRANGTTKKVVIIICYTEQEQQNVSQALNELNLQGAENIIVIDARNDNKPSASVA